jgi:hypothetical protein
MFLFTQLSTVYGRHTVSHGDEDYLISNNNQEYKTTSNNIKKYVRGRQKYCPVVERKCFVVSTSDFSVERRGEGGGRWGYWNPQHYNLTRPSENSVSHPLLESSRHHS